MPQAIAVNPIFAATDKTQGQKPLERKFLNLRTSLDTWLILGSLFLAFGLFICAKNVFQPDRAFLRFGWAAIGFVCTCFITGITCCWVSPLSRRLTFALLLLLLGALSSCNYLLFWIAPDALTLFEVQMLFLGCTAWGLIGMGAICVEQRWACCASDESLGIKVFSPIRSFLRLTNSFMIGMGITVLLSLPFLGIPCLVDQCASAWWPVAEGTLVEPAEQSKKWLRYTYQVDGVDYFGSREMFFFNTKGNYSTHGSAEERLERLKSPSVFPVSYKPNAPEISLLDPGARNSVLLAFWSSCLCVFAMPVYFGLLRDTYSNDNLLKTMRRKLKLTKFEALMTFMALAGFGLWLACCVLMAAGFACEGFAPILLVIAIWWVYRMNSKAAEKLQDAQDDIAITD